MFYSMFMCCLFVCSELFVQERGALRNAAESMYVCIERSRKVRSVALKNVQEEVGR